jgi:hypothetical protein
MRGNDKASADGPQDARKAINDARAAMFATEDPRAMLAIIRVCSRRLDPTDTENIDRLAEIALNIFGLGADEVQAAIADGQRDRDDERAARGNGGTDGDIASIVLTLPQFLAKLKMPDYLVDGLFKRGFLYSVTGMTGGGKTAVALLLSVIVADPARRWKFGPHGAEHGLVVYVTRENPDEVRERLIGMAERMGFNPEELASTFLVIENVADIAKAFDRIKREIEPFGEVALIILDTSAALFVGDDDNNNIQMIKHAKTQRSLTQLTGRPCVIALNHPTKKVTAPDQLLPRGGGGYLNEVDGNFTLWACGDRLSEFHWTGKLRGPDFEKITFLMTTVTPMALKDAKGRLTPTVMARLVTEADIAENEFKTRFQEDRLLKAINASPKASIAQLAAACGWMTRGKDGQPDRPYKSLAQRVLTRLKEEKLVFKDGREHVLTKAGKKAIGIDGGRGGWDDD